MEIIINDEFLIRKVDTSNWALCQKYQSKQNNGTIIEKTREIGYSATIKGAMRLSLDKLPSFAEKEGGICKILKEIAKAAKAINEIND